MKNIQKMFLVFIVFTVIGYSEYALVSIFNNIVVNFQYVVYNLPISFFGNMLRIVKDFILVVLIIQITFYYYKNYKTIIKEKYKTTIFLGVMAVIILEGIISGFISGNFSLVLFAAGIRGLMYLTVVIVVALNFNSREFYNQICSLLDKLFIFEAIIITIQSIQLVLSLGASSLVEVRVCGTFGHCVNLAAFLLAYALHVFIRSYITCEKSRSFGLYLNIVVCGFIILSGSRTAIILISIMLAIMIYINISQKYLKNLKRFDYYILIFLGLLSPILVKAIEILSNRGSILQNNLESGRIKILIDYLTKSNIENVLFGSGLGYGTNTGVLLKEFDKYSNINADILDGTITTFIAQFGVLTLIFAFIMLVYFIISFSKDNYKMRLPIIAYLVLFFGLMMLNGNIFEQYSFILISIYAFISIKQNYNFKVNK